jgi:hypothetical protein
VGILVTEGKVTDHWNDDVEEETAFLQSPWGAVNPEDGDNSRLEQNEAEQNSFLCFLCPSFFLYFLYPPHYHKIDSVLLRNTKLF